MEVLGVNRNLLGGAVDGDAPDSEALDPRRRASDRISSASGLRKAARHGSSIRSMSTPTSACRRSRNCTSSTIPSSASASEKLREKATCRDSTASTGSASANLRLLDRADIDFLDAAYGCPRGAEPSTSTPSSSITKGAPPLRRHHRELRQAPRSSGSPKSSPTSPRSRSSTSRANRSRDFGRSIPWWCGRRIGRIRHRWHRSSDF